MKKAKLNDVSRLEMESNQYYAFMAFYAMLSVSADKFERVLKNLKEDYPQYLENIKEKYDS